MLPRRLAAVFIFVGTGLVTLAFPSHGQSGTAETLRLALPSWVDSGDLYLNGLDGTMAAKPAGRDFEKYIIRPSPGGIDGTGNPATLHFDPNAWTSHPLSSTRRPQRGDDLFQYQLGAYRYRNKEYRRAAEAFLDLINRFEDSELRTKALFWLAASHYRGGDWEESEQSFRILLSGEAPDWMRSTSLVALGWLSQRRGRLDDALSYYRQFLDGYPDSPSSPLVTFLLGDVFYRMKRYNEAAEQFQRAYGAAPGGREKDRALYWWAESRRAGGAYSDATGLYEEYLELYPQGEFGVPARYGIAWCSLGEQKYETAARLFASIPARHPRSSLADEASYLAFWSLYRSGDWSRTGAAANDLLDQYPASPWLERVRYVQAMSLFRSGSHGESLEAFSVMLSAADGPAAPAPTFMSAVSLIGLARYEEAGGRLAELIGQDGGPIPDGVLARHAWASFMAGELSMARKGFSRALDRGVSHEEAAELHYWLGVVEIAAGNTEKAVFRFGKAFDILPEGDRADDAIAAIADVYFSQKKWREAGDIYQRLAELPEGSEFYDRAHLRLAECRAAEGKGEEALQILVAFLDQEREGRFAARALYHVGRLHSQVKRYDKARQELQRLIADHPESDHVDDAKYQIALGLYQDGRFDEAVKALEGLIADHPGSTIVGMAHLKLGDAYYRLRRFSEALEHYRSATGDTAADGQYPEAEYGINLIHLARGSFDQYRKGSIAFARKYRGNPLAPVVLYQLGRQLLLQENYKGASKVFTVLVRDYPGREAWLHAMIGSALTDRGERDRDDLLSLTSEKVSAASRDLVPLLRYRRALLYLEEENCGEALADLLAAGTTGSENQLQRFALFEAAGCLVSEGRGEEAVEIYRRVLHSFPGTEMGIWARFVVGSLLFDRGLYAEAAEEFQRIPAGGGELDAVAAFRIGRAFQFENRTEEAMDQFMLSLSLSPDGPLAQRASYRAAEIAKMTGRRTLAVSLYRKAVSLGGDIAITELSRDGLEAVAADVDDRAEKIRE